MLYAKRCRKGVTSTQHLGTNRFDANKLALRIKCLRSLGIGPIFILEPGQLIVRETKKILLQWGRVTENNVAIEMSC